MAGPSFRHVARAVGVIAVLLATAAPVAAVADEPLVPVPETGAAGFLSLSSSVYPLALPALQAGESFTWQIGISVDQPSGQSTLQLTADGGIAGTNTYLVSVDECDVQWQGSSGLGGDLRCPTASTPRIAPVALAEHRQDVLVPLRDLRGGTSPYLRFILSRPGGSQDPRDTSLTLGIGVTAAGNDDAVSPPAQRPPVPLANTGAAVLQGLLAGSGLLLLGAAAVAAGRRTRARTGRTS
ncbi:hypothetical protein RM50_06945 [Pseudarthrobacter phenanthrenivorans]|uniref:Peptidase n=1 Tax=Pseudarthrobacter phenanthrenivorans TaxID=361575 RepID=A0A0B4DTJ9_PSEPS|nr:hypothetical protein RM50_06945 [Pseudarthrobacter phenanthrenivorans]